MRFATRVPVESTDDDVRAILKYQASAYHHVLEKHVDVTRHPDGTFSVVVTVPNETREVVADVVVRGLQ